MMGQAPAVGLDQPQLPGAKVKAEPGSHWNASQLIDQLAFLPALEDEIWAFNCRLVPLAWTLTV
jgi:hypothetical protein